MFESKKKKLFEAEPNPKLFSTVVQDPFLRGSLETDTILSGNRSIKLKTTGSDFVDQFASASKYRELRSYKDISKDMEALWSQDPLMTLKFTVYIRLITRVCKFPNGETTEQVQIGQGLKHEGIMRLLWLMINHPDAFLSNITVFIVAGSWKDLITMMQYDAMYNGNKHSFNWNILIEVLIEGLKNQNTTHLVRKYLPEIRPRAKCKTVEAQADNLVAKAICTNIFGYKDLEGYNNSYRKYRHLKVNGTAHLWQQAISQRRFQDIDFDTIAGRALYKLVHSKFLENQGLEKAYAEWVMSKPVVKYTGHVYELFANVPDAYHKSLKDYQVHTINAQFNQLVEQARRDMDESDKGLLCVLDTSESMSSSASGLSVSAYTVAKTMTLFFSELLQGRFYNHYFEFSSHTIHKVFKGSTPVEKFTSDTSRITANTDFTSVAKKLVEIRASGVKEKDFPSGMLCLSDGEFDCTYSNNDREVETFRSILLQGGFSKEFVQNFKIILWDIPNGYYGKSIPKFEELADSPNVFHIGGLDGSIIQFLLGKKKIKSSKTPSTSEELFLAAMDQELLNSLKIPTRGK